MIFVSNDITNKSIEFPDNRSTQYDHLIFATFFNCMHLVFQTNGQIKFANVILETIIAVIARSL